MNLKGLGKTIKNFIFTRRCTICGDVCDVRKSLCSACEESPCRIEGDICEKCGAPKRTASARALPSI